jgi:hypothetical protein
MSATIKKQQANIIRKRKPFRQHNKKPEEDKTGAMPIQKYGKGNNFHKSRQHCQKQC